MGGARDLPGPKPTLFFAPAQIKKRSAEWGSQGLAQRMLQGWRHFMTQVKAPDPAWITVQHHQGQAAVQAAYALVLSGKGDPREGHILSL